MENEHQHREAFIATALPILKSLTVTIDQQKIPMVWVNHQQRSDLLALSIRMTAVEELRTHLKTNEQHALRGRQKTRWVYGLHDLDHLFLLQISATFPSYSCPSFTLPALQTHIIIHFDLTQKEISSLLSMIATTRKLLVHFNPIPNWIPLQSEQTNAAQNIYIDQTQGEQLICTGLELNFRPTTTASIKRALEQSHSRLAYQER